MKTSKTDWERLEALTDEEIDYSDIPPLPETFFARARLWRPRPQVEVTVKVDEDIVDWFKTETEDWEARIQAALRLYMEAHRVRP